MRAVLSKARNIAFCFSSFRPCYLQYMKYSNLDSAAPTTKENASIKKEPTAVGVDTASILQQINEFTTKRKRSSLLVDTQSKSETETASSIPYSPEVIQSILSKNSQWFESNSESVIPIDENSCSKLESLLQFALTKDYFRRKSGVVHFQTIYASFCDFIRKRENFPELFDYLIQFEADSVYLKTLLDTFSSYSKAKYPKEYHDYQLAQNIANLTDVTKLFPVARRMKRKIIYHAGPTNSGKTHFALERLKAVEFGAYAAPLRLLAQEVYTKLNKTGVRCSLLTGQEIKEVPLANHISCTVEMLHTDTIYDAVVIDEIQMIGDAQRGFAWTKALIGVCASEVHLCGDPAALGIIRKICGFLNEEVEVREYTRLNQLTVQSTSLEANLKKLEDQDCIVCFSRKDIYYLKKLIETKTNRKCCVVYGSLPPETRNEQADLFNDPNSGYNILIASDAIGMGLNLNIRRIIFYSTQKYDFESGGFIRISSTLAKQISGRAGRHGFYENGLVTTFYPEDLSILATLLQTPSSSIEKAGIFPQLHQLSEFYNIFGKESSLSHILAQYASVAQIATDFFLSNFETVAKMASHLDHLDMPLATKMDFLLSPIPKDAECLIIWIKYAESFANSTETVPLHISIVDVGNTAQLKLQKLEMYIKILDNYLWLANKYPYRFDTRLAESLRDEILLRLSSNLATSTELNVKGKESTFINSSKTEMLDDILLQLLY